jgi:GntR family transcriptional repressor for pyruvate dehydrogenase complex
MLGTVLNALALLDFLEQYLIEAMRVTRANEAWRTDFIEQVGDEHRAIFEAVAAHDPAAARRVAIKHMRRGDRRLQITGLLPARSKRLSKKEPA